MTPRAWITWEGHRRSRGLSAALGATLHEINDGGGRLLRYLRSAWRTLGILVRERKGIVIVQSPSIVLATLATTFGRLTSTRVVIDAHNGGIEPLEGQKGWLTRLARHSLRQADLVIVTNDALVREVEALGGTAFALIDPIPDFPESTHDEGLWSLARSRVLAICTWASDEPYLELLRAASLLPDDCELAITGRPRLTDEQRSALPRNVRLTGFVSDSDYTRLLRSADVIVDLTTRENCLLCGAYEAVAVHKPLVVSDTAALRELLGDAALYCANRADAVASAIRAALDSKSLLTAHARSRDAALRTQWKARRDELDRLLERLVTSISAPLRGHTGQNPR